MKIAAAILLAIITLPFAIVAGIFSKKRECTAQEFASELRQLADGTCEGWDRLESVPLRDWRLETIRL